MVGNKARITLAALIGALALLAAACSSGMSEEEVEARVAQATAGMMTRADAEALARETVNAMMPDPIEPWGNRREVVKERGSLVCAVSDSLAGFSSLDESGNLVGFDIDICRAVAVAVLGDADAVEFRPTAAFDQGPAIVSGEVDVMSGSAAWTTVRDSVWGNFAQTMFYEGQGFMVPSGIGVYSALDLQGALVCVQRGTTTELKVKDFNRRNNMGFEFAAFPDSASVNSGYLAGMCDALTANRINLASARAGFDNPDDHFILPETISEEPLGPVAPHGDDQWYDIVKTVMAILIHAEALEIDSMSVPIYATGDRDVDRMLGFEGYYGQENLGLSQTVAQDIIKAVGNYGEIYERHLTPLSLTREGSRNALWSSAPCGSCPKGGQIYAAPMR